MSYNDEMTEKMSKADKKVYGDYDGKMQAEDDVHTLIRAQEIKSDEERHVRALHCAQAKRDDIAKVAEGE